MCTYNIQIDDNKASMLRTCFKDNYSVEQWMQQQMEILIAQIIKHSSVGEDHSWTNKFAGAWKGSDTAEQMITSIRDGRTSNTEIVL